MTIKADRARQILSRFGEQRILVVGDLMLDRYIYGGVSRISPEAPVPVVRVTHEKSMPGGATNVAWNVQSLGAKATVSGVTGNDQAAEDLRKVLADGGVSTAGMVRIEGCRTTVKTRIIAERQQVVRVDWEDGLELSSEATKDFCRLLEQEVERATGVIIEDYGKGLIRQSIVDAVLTMAAKRGIPTGYDPKDNHELRVDGITVATPNRKEAFVVAGLRDNGEHPQPLQDKALAQVSSILLDRWKPHLLLITLGPQGIFLVEKDRSPLHVPTRAREVFDVSGAGDTVISTCVLALAAGATNAEAAELANYAAGVVVGKLGTATCTQDELLRYLG